MSNSIYNKLEKIDVSADDLDCMVHVAVGEMASRVNNGGVNSQIEFLIQAGFSEDDIWTGVLSESLIPEQTTVDVAHPKHENSTHPGSFTGKVLSFNATHVDVLDDNGTQYTVMFNEIENYHSLTNNLS